jgi:ATP-binding cassette, subfamily C (CFTR/MRP), member 1
MLHILDLIILKLMSSVFSLNYRLTIIISLGSIVYITPWFGVVLVPMGFIYITVLNYFREVARETKRLESISRSPVFAHFSETLGGLATIRSYGQADRFIDAFEKKMDINTRAFYNNKCADRWLSVRLELLGSFIAGAAAVASCSVVINNATSGSAGTDNFSSLAGLSLSFAISITGVLNWTVRSFAQLEAAMNAAERVMHYTENIAQEAPARTEEMSTLIQSPDDEDLYPAKVAVKAKGVEEPESEWPARGNITLHNLKMRYRKENPLVIKGLSVEIKGGERIGVVGRTGSGKSSLLLALLRIVEPALPDDLDSGSYESPIAIDGIDVLRIGIRDLRSKIGIIPQNPVLFSGTIRSNMDPFGLYTDDEIWNAINRCGMKEAVEQMPGLLDAPVAEYGENLSQGQRQLLCLGRALLKKCKILLLDEATSSVDYQTDQEIQRTLREDFAGCTVLTIAHRVNTIMDSDKILVMVDGKVGEFASPDELLADKKSNFSSIVKNSQNEHH